MKATLLRVCLFVLIGACSPGAEEEPSGIRVRIRQFPEAFQPVSNTSNEALSIIRNIYEVPEILDKLTSSILPGFTRLESVRAQGGDTISFTYVIREGAKWEDGSSITSGDIETSLKIYNLPGLNSGIARLQVSDIVGFSGDGDRFELRGVGNEDNLRSRISDFFILPKRIYDPQGILDPLSLEGIQKNYEDLKNDETVTGYKEHYQSPGLQNELIYGVSAAYRVRSWRQGQSILLEKVADWWGHKAAEKEKHLKKYPDQITYEVIPDESVALIALKNGAIDVLAGVSPHEFVELQKNPATSGRFHLLTPVGYRFVYLSFNARLDKLKPTIRQSLARLIPYEEIVNVAALGFAERTVGPINPVDSVYYNNNLDLIQFDYQGFKELLTESGYYYRDGRWENERNEQLSFNLIYRSRNQLFESIALIIKDRFENNGIELNIQALESSLISKKTKAHDFELALGAFRGGPEAHNFRPLFSTEAANIGGLNHSGFGNSQSDSVINLINLALKKEQKINGLKELQRLLAQEKTMLFLFFEKDRIAVSKRFKNVYGFSRSPGYDVTKFQVAN